MDKLLLLLIVSLGIVITGCSDDNKVWEPHSPLNTSSLMLQYAEQNNYKQFNTLLLEGSDEASIKKMFETVKQVGTNSKEIKTFTLVTFDNGKTLLVHLTSETEDGKVLIQDVIEIPTEIASDIEKELNKRFEK
ncbi:hypothetical protein D1B31_01680 [Neobacillus notoginsengisoli]|uniref:Uncharacterized protein n=1 Tax=Neobacillus notoginsengisoli TaxID=1578198 RepID=A0A417Z0B6_9BACI|nr:hypothetical protein [Neobacillus notoginsengisoli]RHW43398.1 hypothetical protein D1B31_01680 [Neobacillus notoginsengisoli]